MTVDPATAPPRDDLPFLRRRSRPRQATTRVALPRPATKGVDYTHPSRKPTVPSAAAEMKPAPPVPKPAPPVPEPASRVVSSSLDLDDAPRTPVPAAATPQHPAPAQPALRVYDDVRVHGSERYQLSVRTPTVTLTRTQSGVGRLTVEAVCSPEAGDLRLGAVYQLRSGGSSTVQLAGGHRFGPPSARRPVLVAGHDDYEHIGVDLRQVADIERLTFYVFSESQRELRWAGTLVVTIFGGAQLELPLETLYRGPTAVLLSIYNFDGELVVRAELETIAGDVREAARAYGYDKITWRDTRTPVD